MFLQPRESVAFLSKLNYRLCCSLVVRRKSSQRRLPLYYAARFDFTSRLEILLQESLENVEIYQLTDGFCNDVFKLQFNSKWVVAKLYSNSSKLRTETKLRGIADAILAELQLAPEVRASSHDGIVHTFIPGKAISEFEIHTNPEFGRKIASLLSKLHGLQIPSIYDREPLIWGWLQSMLDNIKMNEHTFSDGVSVETLENEVACLKRRFEVEKFPIAFCHGDCKPSNLILEESEQRVWMIDLELAGPNYRGFDLMKLFRTAPEQFSSDAFQTFLVNYNSQVSTTFELERECKFCMTLSWLEAAVFFANLISSGGLLDFSFFFSKLAQI